MIKFTELKYKNFLSSGNYFTAFDFLQSKSTLIIGSNGAGKSTMLDALTFALFNKPFRKISKGQLTNTINEKDCFVEVKFEIGNTQWKIVRGIKPNIFQIYKDNVVLDQSSSAIDQQKWLEQSVIKLNYKSFTQIVILGSTNFIPFMQLPSQHRREVVEDLLDIKVFSSMNDIAKYKIKEMRDDIKEFEYKKENLEDKIKSQNILIDELSKRTKHEIENKNIKIKTLIEEESGILKRKLNSKIKLEKLNIELEKFSGSSGKVKKLISLRGKVHQKLLTIRDEYNFFNTNSHCPTCTQAIDQSFRLSKIDQIENKIHELDSGFVEIENAILEEEDRENNFLNLSKNIIDVGNEISQNDTQIFQIQKELSNIKFEIELLLNSNSTKDIEILKMEDLNSKLIDLINDMSNIKEELSNYEFIHMLLKDDGAKTKIIKKYLPVINKTLNKYLDLMEFSVNFHLDEEFNEKSLNPIYEDFSYSSFSEGEKMRIDLALLFTWREIAKLKNSINTNLLILDEVFDSSLDDFGTDNFTKIICHVVKESNVFVISHKTSELEDKFDRVIKFEKQRGFSMMVDF